MAVSNPNFRPTVSATASKLKIQEDTTIAGLCQIVLPDLTKSITLRSRTPCTLKVSDVFGGDYITISQYCSLALDNLDFTGKILYIESSVSITTIETLITHG